MAKAKLRHGYSPHNPEDYATPGGGEKMTQENFQESCDINNILKKYQKTGVIDHVSQFGEQYGELDGQTFHEMMTTVAEAQSMFNELPSKAREYFDNDPGAFLDYVENMDPENPPADFVNLGLMAPDFTLPVIPVPPEPLPPAPAIPDPSGPENPPGD